MWFACALVAAPYLGWLLATGLRALPADLRRLRVRGLVRSAAVAAGLVPAAVSANVEFATATDEGVVVYIRTDARFAKDGLTADIVA